MAITGCLPLADRHFSALSGGEQQRIQLARALAQLWHDGGPRGWLFLDEPTSALDLYHQQHLLRLLKSLTRQGDFHVCVVLHDLNLAALWADRILLLHNGTLVSQGTPETVLQADALARWYGAQVYVGPHPVHASPQVFLAPDRADKNLSASQAGHAPLLKAACARGGSRRCIFQLAGYRVEYRPRLTRSSAPHTVPGPHCRPDRWRPFCPPSPVDGSPEPHPVYDRCGPALLPSSDERPKGAAG